MPELGEVENYRRRWDAACGCRVLRVRLHPRARVFAGTSIARIRRLAGEKLQSSEARGKWMSFRFTGGLWLGVHLGMTGRLWVEAGSEVDRVRDGDDRGALERTAAAHDKEPVRHPPRPNPRHDHLRLVTEAGMLGFSDPRLFGRVCADEGAAPPAWWQAMPPSISSEAFSVEAMREFLRRRARSPLKAVLLDQRMFPGVGNWMADEVLWRSGLHPRLPAGELNNVSSLRLHRALRYVAASAIRIIGEGRRALPRDWLYHHRWEGGGRCPRTGVALVRETVGGRTTCWSPGRQSLGYGSNPVVPPSPANVTAGPEPDLRSSSAMVQVIFPPGGDGATRTADGASRRDGVRPPRTSAPRAAPLPVGGSEREAGVVLGLAHHRGPRSSPAASSSSTRIRVTRVPAESGGAQRPPPTQSVASPSPPSSPRSRRGGSPGAT